MADPKRKIIKEHTMGAMGGGTQAVEIAEKSQNDAINDEMMQFKKMSHLILTFSLKTNNCISK